MARRPVVRPHPLAFQQRTIAAASSAKAIENVLEDTDIFDGGQADA